MPTGGGGLFEEIRKGVADERPDLVIRRTGQRYAGSLNEKPGDPYQCEGPQDHGVFGLGLRSDPPRWDHVAPHEGPGQPAQEDEGCQVEDRRITQVDIPLQKLEVRRHQVVDLERHGAEEENYEPVVDHRVHEACLGIPHESLHPKALAQALEPLAPHAGPVLALTLLPALGTEGEEMERQPEKT